MDIHIPRWPSPLLTTTKTTMKTIFQKFTAATVILLTIILLVHATEAEAPGKQLKQAFRLVISDTFEGYQYEPVSGTTVIFYLEKVTNEAGKDEWNIQQIAGPWGNSIGLVDPSIEFNNSFANEFMLTFQEATRVSIWRSGLTENFKWTARVVDVRDHISKRNPNRKEAPMKYNQ